MIEAEVHLYATEAGGRQSPIPAAPFVFKAPLEIDGAFYDCGMQCETQIEPGGEGLARIVFLSPNLVREKIHLGITFKIWTRGFIGEGRITGIAEPL